MHRNDFTSVVCATDAGREGELIFRLVYEKAGCKLPMERLWISSLEESAIREGFNNLRPGRDFDNLNDAAVGRAKADWVVGMNLTRLFSCIYNSKLNVGRVQTPTLAMIVQRDKDIKTFVKKPFFTAVIGLDGFSATSPRFDEKTAATAVSDACMGKIAKVVSLEEKNNTEKPPLLYDLTTLQRDANKIFGFTAQETLDHTQNLYEKKLCTYPRTDSKYLSDDMEQTALSVLEAINKSTGVDCAVDNPNIKRIMDSSKVTDHHAIIPTVEITKDVSLLDAEKKILGLIKMRLVCAVSGNHQFTSTKVLLDCEGTEFSATGKVVTSEGYKAIEREMIDSLKSSQAPDQSEDKEDKEETQNLPKLTEGQELTVKETKVKEGSTQPPKHFTEATLLSAMERAGVEDVTEEIERQGLGTPATRATIIEGLVSNNYIVREKKNILATERGIKLIDILPDVVKAAKLTADWENKLAQIAKGEFILDDFMSGIIELVKSIIADSKEPMSGHENDFGKAAEAESIGECPNCHKSVVVGKYGAYCSGKCGMNFGYAFGVKLTDKQVKDLLAGKSPLIKGLKSSKGSTFEAKLKVKGVKSYPGKDGKTAYAFDFEMIFPDKKK